MFATDRNLAPKEFKHKGEVVDIGIGKKRGRSRHIWTQGFKLCGQGFVLFFLSVDHLSSSGRKPEQQQPKAPILSRWMETQEWTVLPSVHIRSPWTTHWEVTMVRK